MRDDTTIAVMKTTRQTLEDLKVHKKESFDDLINRIIDKINRLEKQMDKKRGSNKKLSV